MDLVGMTSDAIEEFEDDPYDLVDTTTGDTPRERFRELVRMMKVGDRFALLATLDDPVLCDVYRLSP